MNTFSVSTTLRFAWETFTKRPWFLIGGTAIMLILLWLTNMIQSDPSANSVTRTVVFLVFLGISTLIDMGFTSFYLRAHDDIEYVSYSDIWHPRSFLAYLTASILIGLAVILGLIALLIPGFILMTWFMFVKFLIIDRDLGTIEAMKESIRITKGNRLELFLLLIATITINILGAIAMFVGLLVSVPVSMIALAHAYRTFAQHDNDALSTPANAHSHHESIRSAHTRSSR